MLLGFCSVPRSLSVARLSALPLNLLFRIGIAQRARQGKSEVLRQMLMLYSVALAQFPRASPPWLVLEVPGDCFGQTRVQGLGR
jgi:hypothetical protein